MIKKFSENINEDYFSKLANRKDNGDIRKEKQLPAGFVDLGLSVAFGPKVFDKERDTWQYEDFEEVVKKCEYDAPTIDDICELTSNCELSIDFETKLIYVKSKINGKVLEIRQPETRMQTGYGSNYIQAPIWTTTNTGYRENYILEITGGGRYKERPRWRITSWPHNYYGEFIPVIKIR